MIDVRAPAGSRPSAVSHGPWRGSVVIQMSRSQSRSYWLRRQRRQRGIWARPDPLKICGHRTSVAPLRSWAQRPAAYLFGLRWRRGQDRQEGGPLCPSGVNRGRGRCGASALRRRPGDAAGPCCRARLRPAPFMITESSQVSPHCATSRTIRTRRRSQRRPRAARGRHSLRHKVRGRHSLRYKDRMTPTHCPLASRRCSPRHDHRKCEVTMRFRAQTAW